MKKIINTQDAPSPIGPYSQGVMVNGFLFVSGQIPVDPTTGNLDQDEIKSATHRVMKNIGAILKSAGMDYSHIVKTSIFLTDLTNFNAVNDVYGSYFKENFPARETIQVSRLPKDAKVEISVVAVG